MTFRPERGRDRGQHVSKDLISSFGEVMWNIDNVARKVPFVAKIRKKARRNEIDGLHFTPLSSIFKYSCSFFYFGQVVLF